MKRLALGLAGVLMAGAVVWAERPETEASSRDSVMTIEGLPGGQFRLTFDRRGKKVHEMTCKLEPDGMITFKGKGDDVISMSRLRLNLRDQDETKK